MNFSEQYEIYRKRAEEVLCAACERMTFEPEILGKSMRYSLLSGGKRVRPVLYFAALDAFGVPCCGNEMLAVALECIHTYSLIHDDLPAMDNDDYRRGRLSNHKMFGEGNAVLAGDALLSYAFDVMLAECGRGEGYLHAARALSRAAGAEGMIAGQSADLLYTGENAGEEELLTIYRNKTGCLIAAPLVMAACIAGRNEVAAERFGLELGTLFQLTDDILDATGEREKLGKSVGKDAEEQKLTAVKIYTLDGAMEQAKRCAARCREALLSFEGANTEFLNGMVDYVLQRDR